jgi:predicted ABC-type ATPase
LLDLGREVSEALRLARKEIISSRKSRGQQQAVEQLIASREKFTNKVHSELSKDRGDGRGTHFENPNSRTFNILQALQKYNEKIDHQINRLENRPLKTAVGPNGKEFKFEGKRWYDDKNNLERFKGFTSRARKEYEERLIESYLKGVEKQREPRVIFMMGGPASGKSTLLNSKYSGQLNKFVVVDPDDIKSKLPEFMFGVGVGYKEIAAIVHSNSSRIAKEIRRRALERGLNVLVDGTGRDLNGYRASIQDFKAKGYKTELLSQHVPQDVGVKRAVLRAELPVSMGGGRFVPLPFIEQVYATVPRNFLPLASLVDSATLNDNVGNKVIMEYKGGKVIKEDPRAAAAYRRAYGP